MLRLELPCRPAPLMPVDIAKRRALDGSCANACKKLPVMCKNLLTDLLAGN